MKKFNFRLITSALFLPLLYWTGAVVAVSLSGYPGVVCITPAAWLLAFPVGLRVQRESKGQDGLMTQQAALAGALLGLFQGLLFGAAMIVTSTVEPGFQSANYNALMTTLAMVALGVPITGAIAGATAWAARLRQPRQEN